MAYRLDLSQRRLGETPIIMASNVLSPDQCRKVVELGTALLPIDGRICEATLHRLRPVTRGQRHSLVAWASGPRFR